MFRFFNWHERLLIGLWILCASVSLVAVFILRMMDALPFANIAAVVAIASCVTYFLDREDARRSAAHECMMSWSRRISDEGPTCSPSR